MTDSALLAVISFVASLVLRYSVVTAYRGQSTA